MLYELRYDKLPFGICELGENATFPQVLKKIQTNDLIFADNEPDEEFKDLLTGLLSKDTKNRLNKADSILSHKFFEEMNIERIAAKKMVAPEEAKPKNNDL